MCGCLICFSAILLNDGIVGCLLIVVLNGSNVLMARINVLTTDGSAVLWEEIEITEKVNLQRHVNPKYVVGHEHLIHLFFVIGCRLVSPKP
ncbi:hypothetical protein AVEN_78787-1 [Araneus ventricosus]|uniref:Uncharacterized protein n=1 Tax=Araneus ventricosus TaxID=182803 RepID=A0A4Y2NYB7_ARAVE|nr:hypothetical protein AVEN_78787-1 [Araneus ventricosus]